MTQRDVIDAWARSLDFERIFLPRSFERKEREKVLELYTRDISSDGAFFYTNEPLPVDTDLSMTLFLPAGPTPKGKISVDGKVIRTEQEGMAVRFNPDYTLVAV